MEEKRIKDWLASRKKRKESFSVDALSSALVEGDVMALSTAITLLESTVKEDARKASDIIKTVLPHTGSSIRIGITGVPGVGKSSFIEVFGSYLAEQGKKLAVLAIDPSSSTSGGSILGDKTRMQNLTTYSNVFIRPSAAGSSLGGVARKTRESILLCEAAGFDVVLIETVGVGQSETLVHSMVDFFLLLMLAGAGDELQGIKRGIMEMADVLVITKADGDNAKKANQAAVEYRNAMHLFPPRKNGWVPTTMTCSSHENVNIDQIWSKIEAFINQVKVNGAFTENRHEQDVHWLHESLNEYILSEFYEDEELNAELHQAEKKVKDGQMTSFQAAEFLFNAFVLKRKRDGDL